MSSNSAINCLNIAYVFKASIGSINGSWTEGNVSTIKKITLPDGRLIPYVSGQSIKFQLRKFWKEQGLALSEVVQAEKTKGVNPTLGDPMNFIDDDLMGYMIASKNANRRRTAAVRISPAIGQFEFKGDIDMGTKSKELSGEDMGEGGNIFETEISYNYYRVNALVEIDRIGRFLKQELSGKDDAHTSPEVRKERMKHLLNGFRNIWGGGKQSRLLTDMSPKFVVFTFQSVKNPILLETLNINEQEKVHIDALVEVLEDNKKIIESTFIGVRQGVFNNYDEIIEKLTQKGYSVRSIDDAFTAAAAYIDGI